MFRRSLPSQPHPFSCQIGLRFSEQVAFDAELVADGAWQKVTPLSKRSLCTLAPSDEGVSKVPILFVRLKQAQSLTQFILYRLVKIDTCSLPSGAPCLPDGESTAEQRQQRSDVWGCHSPIHGR